MRLLVIDQGRILAWLVRHNLPPEIEIESVSSLPAAERLVDECPPDAIVASVPPAHLPWRDFHHRCATRVPPIPVLFESSEPLDGRALGLDPADPAPTFLAKPASREALRAALGHLLHIPSGPAARSEHETG